MSTKCIAGAAMIASLAGCVDQITLPASANAVIVHAVLDVTVPDQNVIVQTTNGIITQQVAVGGATVVIAAPDGRQLVAKETRDSSVYGAFSGTPRVDIVYRISSVVLTAGGTYHLRVTLPDGRVVTGSTTIPSVAPVVPQLTTTIDRLRDTVRLSWPRSPGARAYEVFISSSGFQGGIFADTSIVLPGVATTGNRLFFQSGLTHQIVVNAVDENYYDYFRRGSDAFTGSGPISRLNGAIGVFGSIAPVARRTVIVR